jgi:hypothetical protein
MAKAPRDISQRPYVRRAKDRRVVTPLSENYGTIPPIASAEQHSTTPTISKQTVSMPNSGLPIGSHQLDFARDRSCETLPTMGAID